jgi:hypothetical protein
MFESCGEGLEKSCREKMTQVEEDENQIFRRKRRGGGEA